MKGDMAAVKFVFEQLGAGEEALLSPPAMKLGPEDMEVLNNKGEKPRPPSEADCVVC